MRFTTIALAALAAIVASAAPAGAQAPETHFVCEEVGACEFASIQAAVNTAKAGDTIRVRSGVYDEHVTIPAGKDGLVLRGAQAGVAGSARAGRTAAEESLLYGAPSGTALSVASSGVTVDGFSSTATASWRRS
jgi:pectin methylesterase-like acyl-CoA thioesterase